MKKNYWKIVILLFLWVVIFAPNTYANKLTTEFIKVIKETELIIVDENNVEIERVPIALGTVFQVISETEADYSVSWNDQIGFILKDVTEPASSWDYYTNSTIFKPTVDTAVFKMEDGKLVKRARLLKGETFKRIGEEGLYHLVQFSSFKGYVLKDETEPVIAGELPNGIVEGSKFTNRMISLNVTNFYYSNGGKLTPMARMEKKIEVQAIEAYRDYFIVELAGRRAYVKKSDVNRYVGDFVNPRHTYTYEQMIKDLKDIRLWYADMTEIQIIGNSVDGRNLYALKLGRGKEEIFINGSHHAREHLTTNVVMEMIDAYAYAYLRNQTLDGYNVREILDKTSIWFVPMVNPDGVTLVQKGYKSAKNPSYVLKLNGNSKDFSSWKANIRGVDLNRQYPADWENICCDPGKPGPQNYKGKRPLSEPEAKALVDFTLKHQFKSATAYHSSGEILYWHFNQSYSNSIRDKAIANKIKEKTGYALVPAVRNPSGGGYTDWFIQELKKPGFTPEISKYVGPRPVPTSSFDSIWKKNYSIGLMLAKET
ncbi:M14 family metallocarboxypeptidase [Cytobacillus spongiae]|uniref:M14 family metallopeptidase n=1 Tax=Cytobacillus spongiae TaxID=2901381 RepID=UPI001F1CDA06|nr:M14 family metallocarboxypeptidase [Cytobacillus spongiae]UII55639.1 M14 family metallocarboxypeptidase [Cytobacillus spongiae]